MPEFQGIDTGRTAVVLHLSVFRKVREDVMLHIGLQRGFEKVRGVLQASESEAPNTLRVCFPINHLADREALDRIFTFQYPTIPPHSNQRSQQELRSAFHVNASKWAAPVRRTLSLRPICSFMKPSRKVARAVQAP